MLKNLFLLILLSIFALSATNSWAQETKKGPCTEIDDSRLSDEQEPVIISPDTPEVREGDLDCSLDPKPEGCT